MRARSAVVVASLLLIAGCAANPTGVPSASSSSSTNPSLTMVPSLTPGQAKTAASSPRGERSTDQVDLTDVAIHAEGGFERVELTFSGANVDDIGYEITFVDAPSTQGKDEAISIPGEAVLAVRIDGLSFPPKHATLSGPVANSTQGIVKGIYVDPVFEGQAFVYIGLAYRASFSENTINNPSRLVIDILS